MVLTDDANSDVCRKLDKAIEKIYIYPTENPMEMSLIGWAALLKELKISKCYIIALYYNIFDSKLNPLRF